MLSVHSCDTVLTASGAIMQKRAAIYVRVSTDKQTVENQVTVLRQIAERRGWEIIGQYSDAGISGAKGRDGLSGGRVKDSRHSPALPCYQILVARRAALCEDQNNATVSSMLHTPEYRGTISQKLPHHSRPAPGRNKNEAVIQEEMRRSLAPAPTALLFPQRSV